MPTVLTPHVAALALQDLKASHAHTRVPFPARSTLLKWLSSVFGKPVMIKCPMNACCPVAVPWYWMTLGWSSRLRMPI